MMKKILIAACVIGTVFAATECNKLLNCLACKDESHCETCPEGYTLDSNAVCRFDCAAKFGIKCTECTAEKCICPKGKKWDSDKSECVDVVECSETDPAACAYCGVGFDLLDLNGKCSTCAAVFGNGCSKCSESKCLNTTEGFKLCGAVAVAKDANCSSDCATLFPGCTKCNESLAKCETCADTAVLDKGFCKYKLPTCEDGKKVLLINNAFTCGTCQSFDENCIANRCSGTGCTMCKTGFAVTSTGTCINCSSTFPGCGLCQEDACTKCGSSSWILTPNGCFNQNPYVPPKESNGGMIAGIVIACIIFVVVVILAIYCIVTSTTKHGQIDPSLYEDDLEFKSVSVL